MCIPSSGTLTTPTPRRQSRGRRWLVVAVLFLAAAHFSVQVHGIRTLRHLPYERAFYSAPHTSWTWAVFRVSTEPLNTVFYRSFLREGRGWSGTVTRFYLYLTRPGTSVIRNVVVFAGANTVICLLIAFLPGMGIYRLFHSGVGRGSP